MGAVEAVGHLGDTTGVRHVDGARYLDESLLQMNDCKIINISMLCLVRFG